MIDFSELVRGRGGRSMYWRYPVGKKPEKGERWVCYCGEENEVEGREEAGEWQKCVGCRSVMKLQESYKGSRVVTMSLVRHEGEAG